MYFCPKCNYSFDVTKLSSEQTNEKEEISSLSTLIKKITKNDNMDNIKITIPKNTLINDEKFKKLKDKHRTKILSLYNTKASNIIFHCFVCGALSSDNHMVCIRLKTFLKSATAASF